jgi:hypothetical protein
LAQNEKTRAAPAVKREAEEDWGKKNGDDYAMTTLILKRASAFHFAV